MWEYERIEHDDGRITYEVHEPTDFSFESERGFYCFEGVNAR